MKRGYKFNQEVNVTVSIAAVRGHSDAAKYLISQDFQIDDKFYMIMIQSYDRLSTSCKKGRCEMIRHMSEDCGIPLKVEHFHQAARTNCVELVALLHILKCPWDAEVFAIAARYANGFEVHILSTLFLSVEISIGYR